MSNMLYREYILVLGIMDKKMEATIIGLRAYMLMGSKLGFLGTRHVHVDQNSNMHTRLFRVQGLGLRVANNGGTFGHPGIHGD